VYDANNNLVRNEFDSDGDGTTDRITVTEYVQSGWAQVFKIMDIS
jgi:hypothetical protein